MQETMKQTKANQAQVVLVGHSLGTAIALHFAAENPSTVAGLVLIGVARSASHIPAVRERMLNMASSTREDGIKWAADLASKSNFAPADFEAMRLIARAQSALGKRAQADLAYERLRSMVQASPRIYDRLYARACVDTCAYARARSCA